MQLEIFKDFELIDIVCEFVRFERGRKFRSAGEFTLELNSLDYVDSLKRDNYILFQNDCYIIENIHKYKNGDNETKVEVTGRHLNSILDRRVVAEYKINTTQTCEVQIYNLVNSNFVNSSDKNKKIEYLNLASLKGISNKPVEVQTLKSKDLLEIINQLCSIGNLGFRINLLPEEKAMEFEVIEGNNVVETVFFSEDFGNVAESELYEQGIDFKNVGYLNNNGVVKEFGSGTGLQRRECIVDGSETARIVDELEKRKVLVSAEGTILLTDQFIYREDWDLGDVVSFIDNSLGFVVEKPVLEIKESYDSGFNIDVVFGDKIPTIYEKLGRK